MTFRTRIFVAAFLAASIALAVSTVLTERSLREYLYGDVREALLTEARLAAVLLDHQPAGFDPEAEADRTGQVIGQRVTLVAADGRVLGDSAVGREDLAALELHLDREEIDAAARTGEGTAIRLSETTGQPTMYAAVRTAGGEVAYARVALPLTNIDARVAAVRRLALIGLGAGLAAAMLLTLGASALLNRRLRAVVETARRYRAGDFTPPARDPRRDEIGVVAAALDETARALGAQVAAMARERAHTDAILTGMVEGVVLVNDAGRLVLTNPAVRTMLRLPDAAGGRHYQEVVRHPAIAAQLSQALAGQHPAPAEVELDSRTRRILAANVVSVPAAQGGGAVLVLHDITTLKRADRIRRDFVANVSHELRTPLTAIRGYVEALRDEPTPAQSRQFLEIIARHSMRMDRLVSDLLRLARLDAGQDELHVAACSLAETVEAVQRDMAPQLAARAVAVDVDIAGDAGLVHADPAKLHDVLRNLIENAVNYSPQGGTITVAAREAGDEIAITVADRGPGIPEADLSRIFERFYRTDRARADDPGGTGLGLSIVRHLVELHGGRASAANRAGGGAVLTVHLPRQPSA